jgi:hypothetical protein
MGPLFIFAIAEVLGCSTNARYNFGKGKSWRLQFRPFGPAHFDGRHAPVAQLDRAADFESVGREFESPQARQSFHKTELIISGGLDESERVLPSTFAF